MPPISRDQVTAAVALYGRCWTEQNPSLLCQLFTSDAIYVERAYDKNATFRGLEAIQEYWRYQIVGKQSNVTFRHVVDEMVRDAAEPIVVVKWLAEFDNRRENRTGATSDKTYKRVRFCQMAKLIFDGSKICYLEEYAQACTGPGVKWPDGFDDDSALSDKDLWLRIRLDPVISKPPAKAIVCSHCGAHFPSKSQLFKHLRSLEEEEEQAISVWVCLSVGYVSNVNIGDRLKNALSRLPEEAAVEMDSFTWVVPPEFAGSAIANVSSIKMSKRYIDSVSIEALPKLLNEELRACAQGVLIHTAAVVDRPCIQERREFEKYEAFIPWTVLQGQDESAISPLPSVGCGGWSRSCGHKRRPLEETKAAEFCDPDFVKRLRDGARLLRDCGCCDLDHFAKQIRLRACAMCEPWHEYCRISLSVQNKAGLVEMIIGLLISYGRSILSDEELISAAKSSLGGENTSEQVAMAFPIKYICLLAPFIDKYEGKTGISLCTSSTNVSESMRSSFDEVESATIKIAEKGQDELKRWVAALTK
jgi:hypothetical protein